MAMQKQKSALMAKLGNVLRKAHEEHKGDETEYSKFGNLPSGISNGIAQLVECKVDTYKKGDNEGEYYFMAAGVVVSPKSIKTADGVIPIEGLRTMIIEPLCDTPKKKNRKTVADHYAWILNELRKLGVETNGMEVDDLETTLAALKESQPHFRFRTWSGEPTEQYPEPLINHQWEGAVEYEAPEGDEEVADNSGSDEVEDTVDVEEEDTPPPPKTSPKKPAGPSKPAAPAKPAKPTPKSTPPVKAPASSSPGKPPVKGKKAPPPVEEFDDQGDIDTLLERANSGDEDAQNRLSELAVANGWTEEDVSTATAWEEVKEMALEPPPPPAEEEEEEEPASLYPEVGEVWLFTPKGAKKPTDCEVTAVNPKKGTATLKNLSNPKLSYENVPFSAMTTE